MTYLLAFLLFTILFALMAVGYIFGKKVLQKGCALGSDCTCKAQNKDPENCEHETK